jgi:hypothetical protein
MASHLTDEQLREAYLRAVAARRDPRRTACPTPDALLAAVRREGSEDRRLLVFDHAMGCADCRGDLELLRAIEASRRADVARSVESRQWRAPLYILLAASVVFLAALALWKRPQHAAPDDVFRGNGPAVVAIAPSADTTVAGGPLTFSWHAFPGARRYAVEILTAQGGVAAVRETTDTSATLGDLRFDPGDYTWWVRARLDGAEVRSSARRLRIGR